MQAAKHAKLLLAIGLLILAGGLLALTWWQFHFSTRTDFGAAISKLASMKPAEGEITIWPADWQPQMSHLTVINLGNDAEIWRDLVVNTAKPSQQTGRVRSYPVIRLILRSGEKAAEIVEDESHFELRSNELQCRFVSKAVAQKFWQYIGRYVRDPKQRAKFTSIRICGLPCPWADSQ